MAVVNANKFSLLDVVNETTSRDRSLAGCISNANKSGWMIAYMGNRDRLTNFRGYSHAPGYY